MHDLPETTNAQQSSPTNLQPTNHLTHQTKTRRQHRQEEKRSQHGQEAASGTGAQQFNNTAVPQEHSKSQQVQDTTTGNIDNQQETNQRRTRSSYRQMEQRQNEQQTNHANVTPTMQQSGQPEPTPPQIRETTTPTPSETSHLEGLPIQQWNNIELATTKLQNRHLSGGDFPLPDSPTWTAQGEWSNVDLDECIRRWKIINPTIVALHSKIILDAQTSPARVVRQLQEARTASQKDSHQIHIILWIRHHWIATTVDGNKMMIMDSAPGIAQEDDFRTIAEFFGTALKEDIIIVHMKVWSTCHREPHAIK